MSPKGARIERWAPWRLNEGWDSHKDLSRGREKGMSLKEVRDSLSLMLWGQLNLFGFWACCNTSRLRVWHTSFHILAQALHTSSSREISSVHCGIQETLLWPIHGGNVTFGLRVHSITCHPTQGEWGKESSEFGAYLELGRVMRSPMGHGIAAGHKGWSVSGPRSLASRRTKPTAKVYYVL